MSSQTPSRLLLRIIPVFYVVSIAVFVGLGEFLLSAETSASLPNPLFARSDFQVLHIVLSVMSALMVSFAVAIKRSIIGGSAGGMRGVVKAIMRNTRKLGRGSGSDAIIIPLSLSEGVAAIGFVLFVIGGGERVLCYPFYGVALISLIAVLPNAYYVEKAVALDEEVRRELAE